MTSELMNHLYDVQEKLTDQEYKTLVEGVQALDDEGLRLAERLDRKMKCVESEKKKMEEDIAQLAIGQILRDNTHNWQKLTPSLLKKKVMERFPLHVNEQTFCDMNIKELIVQEICNIHDANRRMAKGETEDEEEALFPIRR